MLGCGLCTEVVGSLEANVSYREGEGVKLLKLSMWSLKLQIKIYFQK